MQTEAGSNSTPSDDAVRPKSLAPGYIVTDEPIASPRLWSLSFTERGRYTYNNNNSACP